MASNHELFLTCGMAETNVKREARCLVRMLKHARILAMDIDAIESITYLEKSMDSLERQFSVQDI